MRARRSKTPKLITFIDTYQINSKSWHTACTCVYKKYVYKDRELYISNEQIISSCIHYCYDLDFIIGVRAYIDRLDDIGEGSKARPIFLPTGATGGL